MRKQQGFTLIELMVVVAILSITAAFVIKNFKRHPVGSDARKVANLMATAYRTAVSAGAVRADVAAANGGLRARAQISFAIGATRTTVTIWRLFENAAPSTGYQWVAVLSTALDDDVMIWTVADTANINLSSTAITQTAPPATIIKSYNPDASADAFTVYLAERSDPTNRYRVVSMPLSPAPQVFKDW